MYEVNGEIVHEVGAAINDQHDVLGKIDWDRRHDHMQQHTGQHILSQALIQISDIPTVGFAIGPDWSTIVLGRKPGPDELDSALRLANSVVDENRPVDVLFPSPSELEELPVRGALPDKEAIRIVRVEGFDWSPCGGTHCESTADVRLILVLGIRKEKETYRLEFVCGRRAEDVALKYARDVHDVAAVLDVGAIEIVERTRLILDKLRAQEDVISELREDRLRSDFAQLISTGRSDEGIFTAVLHGRTANEVRQLAHMLVERPGTVALLVGNDQGTIGLAFARSDDRAEDMKHIMKRVCAEMGCRGGGNAAFATGGGSGDMDAESVLEAAERALGSM